MASKYFCKKVNYVFSVIYPSNTACIYICSYIDTYTFSSPNILFENTLMLSFLQSIANSYSFVLLLNQSYTAS